MRTHAHLTMVADHAKAGHERKLKNICPAIQPCTDLKTGVNKSCKSTYKILKTGLIKFCFFPGVSSFSQCFCLWELDLKLESWKEWLEHFLTSLNSSISRNQFLQVIWVTGVTPTLNQKIFIVANIFATNFCSSIFASSFFAAHFLHFVLCC